jgi:hypothetical protein
VGREWEREGNRWKMSVGDKAGRERVEGARESERE